MRRLPDNAFLFVCGLKKCFKMGGCTLNVKGYGVPTNTGGLLVLNKNPTP